jgi:hypothetical protein
MSTFLADIQKGYPSFSAYLASSSIPVSTGATEDLSFTETEDNGGIYSGPTITCQPGLWLFNANICVLKRGVTTPSTSFFWKLWLRDIDNSTDLGPVLDGCQVKTDDVYAQINLNFLYEVQTAGDFKFSVSQNSGATLHVKGDDGANGPASRISAIWIRPANT